MNQNNRYLLRQWRRLLIIPGIILVTLIVQRLLAAFYDTQLPAQTTPATSVTPSNVGNTPPPSNLPTVLILGAALAMFIGFRMRQTRTQLTTLLKQPSLDQCLAWYQKVLARAPDSDCFIAANQGIMSAYYGNFAKARQFYESVNWTAKVPLLAAQGMIIQILLDFLERQAYEDGYQRATRARKMATASKFAPGSQTSDRGFETYVLIGEILRGNATGDVVERLRQLFDKQQLLMKLPAAWALRQAYQRVNRPAEADAMLAYIKTNGPYCRALLTDAFKAPPPA